jgi:hypothetical protein
LKKTEGEAPGACWRRYTLKKNKYYLCVTVF